MKSFDDLYALITQRGVHAEFGAAGEGWGIEQSPYELATFLVRMQELGVTSCLEIGTGYKGGLSRFLVADMGWRVTTVDVVDYGHKFEGVEYIILDTFPTLPNQTYDLLFIDGNHSVYNCESDYQSYKSLATKAIAFHDIMGLRGCEGVLKYWSELAANPTLNTHRTIAAEKMAGIGWIEL